MESVIKILLLVTVSTYITNHSGFLEDISKRVWEWRNKGQKWKYQLLGKPWSCITCQGFWIGVIVGGREWGWIIGLSLGVVGSLLSMLMNIILKRIIGWLNRINGRK